jgi:hypothetical protein
LVVILGTHSMMDDNRAADGWSAVDSWGLGA